MKLVLEINGTPEKDDLLVWDGESYKPISKSQYLKLSYENEKAIEELKTEMAEYKKELENELNELKEKINKKLKEYHDILGVLVE